MLLVAVALCMGSLELYHALQRHGMKAAIQPIIVGTMAISIGSYLAGIQRPVVFSTTSVLLGGPGADRAGRARSGGSPAGPTATSATRRPV